MAFGLVSTQVTRTDEFTGDVLLAWKVEDTIDPLYEDILWLEDGVDPPSGYEAYEMMVGVEGTRGSVGQGRWATCYICRYDYPISEMVKHRGRYYCKPQKCFEDIE